MNAPVARMGKVPMPRPGAQVTVKRLAIAPPGLAKARVRGDIPENENRGRQQVPHPQDALWKDAALRRLLFFGDAKPHNPQTMDDIVRQAIAKWPHVPHCYGWLGLDARGNWYMRDDRTQAVGPFPGSKGSLLKHEKLVDFIHRNYEPDHRGCWFFQNGPQRVYVELEAAPWVWRLGTGDTITSHSGRVASQRSCALDENGRLYLDTDIGFGLIHTLDMEQAADAVEQGRWVPQDLLSSELPNRFGFVRSPQLVQTEPASAPSP